MKGTCKKMHAGQVIDILLERCCIIRIPSIDSDIASLKMDLAVKVSIADDALWLKYFHPNPKLFS